MGVIILSRQQIDELGTPKSHSEVIVEECSSGSFDSDGKFIKPEFGVWN